MEAHIIARTFDSTIEYIVDVKGIDPYNVLFHMRYVYVIDSANTYFCTYHKSEFTRIPDLTEMDEGELFQQSLVLNYKLSVPEIKIIQHKCKKFYDAVNENLLIRGFGARDETGYFQI